MAYGDRPYDYLPHAFLLELAEVLDEVPEARRHLDAGRVPSARKALEDAGHLEMSGRLALNMPPKYGG